MTEEERFGRYLLGELLWELARFGMAIPGLTDVPREMVEVLSFSGYHIVRMRVGSAIVHGNLSWRGDVPPTMEMETIDLPA